ncbi:BTAD domain-containing putative transcriptional regulator [Dactylosporangium sp. NPDC000555]|uniref:BTAD domain-containing putative transcriptional regulator n=1 Tax=Dactylosporangium sp. NPDC000555 TaxID=3154260 RepID=UPI003333AFE1
MMHSHQTLRGTAVKDAHDGPPVHFGHLLRTWREVAALTQRELASLADISAAAVRDLEQRRTLYPHPASVRRLCEALGLTGDDAEALRRAAVRPTAPAERFDTTAIRPVRILVLGPIAVQHGDTEAQFGADRQRTLLGRLALTPNEAAPRAELIDLLWPDEPPESAVSLVQTYVTRLRRLLNPSAAGPSRAGMLRSGPTGYLLRADADQLDLLRFRELVDQARDARPPAALDLLDNALALWRGAPAGDVGQLLGHPRSLSLTNERIEAALQQAEIADRLGCHGRSLTALRTLSEEHPLHEPLWGWLMLALAASGLQAAALDAYERIRGRLADELGIDPGPELAQFHRRVLRQHWSRTSIEVPPPEPDVPQVVSVEGNRPFQTPAPVADFTGREAQLRLLCELLRRGPSGPAPISVMICAIAGPGGVGKTSLAVQAAHLVRDDYPDGQLYADLRGDGLHPLRPIEVLSQLLRALGVTAALIPTDEAECSALYRSTLAARRVLIVLDNARDARQVRPLLPGWGGCGVIVTSRRRMVDLEAANAIDLETMPVDEAVDLFAKIAGPTRVFDDPVTAAAVARMCGGLPLAVRIAGARLANRPNWTVDTLARRLGDEVRRLDELRAGDLQVGATFQLSYQDLAEPTAKAFRLLAVGPINEWSVPAAAALLGLRQHEAEDVLDDLVDGSLLLTPAPGRYLFHDLLRLYARNLSLTDDGPIEQADALERLYTFYADRVAETATLQHPNMVRLLGASGATGQFGDRDEALLWLDTELPEVVSIIEHASRQGPRPLAWTLADKLRGYFFSTRQATQWFATGKAGLSAAQQAGDRRAQAAMYQTLGQAHWSIGEFRQSLRQYRLGLALAESTSWFAAVSYINHNIGLVHLALGEPEQARKAYLEALAGCRAHGHDYVEAVTLNDLGMMCWELGQFAAAAAYLADALTLNQRGGNLDGEGINRHNLGLVLREMGRFDEALVQFEHCEGIHRRLGSRYAAASVLEQLALLYAETGHPQEKVIDTARFGLELIRATHDRPGLGGMLVTLGSLLFDAGQPDEAAQCMRDSYVLAQAVGAPYLQTRALIGLATAHLYDGAVREAGNAAQEALRLARKGGYRMLEADALVACAQSGCGSQRDLYEQALRISVDAGAQSRVARIERLMRSANRDRTMVNGREKRPHVG